MIRGLTLGIGSMAEITPVVDLLPIETITVIIIYLISLYDRKSQSELDKVYKKAAEMENPVFS